MKRKLLAISIIAAMSSVNTYADSERRSIMELFSKKEEKVHEVSEQTQAPELENNTRRFVDMKLTDFKTLTERYQNDQVVLFYLASKDIEKGDTQSALRKYIKSANLGLPEAVHNVISLLFQGYGSADEIQESIGFVEKLAIQGDAKSQTYLGRIYTDGTISGREKEGLFWYKKAADQDYEEAVYSYGSMLLSGKKAPQNGIEAYKYLSRIAEDNLLAAKNLGIGYDYGVGLEPNYSNALKYYKMASNLGDIESKYRLGQMYHEGKGTLKSLEKAKEHLDYVFDSGVKKAGYELAMIELELSESKNSRKLAIKYLEDAANIHGNSKAQTKLGDLYSDNNHPETIDIKEAIRWYEAASDMGDPLASRRLYFIYANGAEGVEKDNRKSQFYLKESLGNRDKVNSKPEDSIESFIPLYDR